MLKSFHIVSICWYLCVSVLYPFIYSYICAYLCISVHICAYLCISVHICAYLFISKNLIFQKKTLFFKKQKFSFKFVLRKGRPVRSSKLQNCLIHTRNRSQDLPGVCNSPNRCADSAVKIIHLVWYIFLKCVHICQYLFISVHICAYARLCVHLPFISWFSAFLTSICPYMDGGAQPAVRVAGYWQFVTDTYDIHRYEQDMLTWVSYEEICTCEYLGEKYKQISTYLNGTKKIFSGESVNITWISCQYPWISCQYLWISCQYPVNMFKYPLLRGNFFYIHGI